MNVQAVLEDPESYERALDVTHSDFTPVTVVADGQLE